MKLYVPSAYHIGVALLLLLNPPTNTAAASVTTKSGTPILNINGKDKTDENYYLLHPSHEQRTLKESVLFPAGLWTSYGFGYAINSTGTLAGGVNMYDETNISCIPLPTAWYDDIETWKWIGDNNSTIEYNGIIFTLTNTNQSGCSKGITPTINDTDIYVRDPLYDYDVMVQWFKQIYPCFAVKNIDWNKSTQEARLLLSSNSSDTELWDIMKKVLMPLDDLQVGMYTDDSYFYTKVWEINNIMEKEALDIGESDVELYTEQERLKFVDKVTTYMVDSKPLNITNATVCDCGSNYWSYGQIKGTTIGYMLLFNFAIDPDTTPISEDLDRLFQTAFQNMSSMIIDIRINGGGYDSMALLLASYFSSERQLAWTHRARQYQVDDGLMDAESYYLNSSSFHFKGPVVVMMSESTVGSGESFILAMSLLSQVTFFGTQTPDALAMDSNPKMLPNGWYVILPEEVMVSPNGTIYEGRGLSPDIIPDTDFMAGEERHSSTDTWLEMAIKYLNNTNNTNNTTNVPEATTSSSSSKGTRTFDSLFHLMTLVIIMIVTLTYCNLE